MFAVVTLPKARDDFIDGARALVGGQPIDDELERRGDLIEPLPLLLGRGCKGKLERNEELFPVRIRRSAAQRRAFPVLRT